MEVKVKVFKKKNLICLDKFSRHKPIFSSITLSLEDEIKTVLSEYIKEINIVSIKFIGNLKDINNASNSLNFKIKLKNKNNFLLKRISKKNLESVSLKKIIDLIKWCTKEQISMPSLINTTDGKPYLLLNDNYWMLMEFLKGTYFNGSINHLKQSALVSGILFRNISKLPKLVIPKRCKEPYFLKKEIQTYLKLKSSRNEWDSIFGSSMASKLRKNWDLIDSTWNNLNKTQYLSKKYNKPIHHDLHPHNFLFSKKVAFVLDYESLILGPVQSAIGFSILKLLKYMHDNNYKKSFENKSGELFYIWFLDFSKNFPNSYNKEEILKFGKAEVFRRFLSMTDKTYKKITSSFNAPEVHLDTLLVAEKI